MKSLSDFKLSRRGFLQALGLTTVAAVLPPVATKELIATSDPSPVPGAYLAGTIGDSLLDMPIDEEHPFGWIRLNSERMKLNHISLTVRNQVTESPFSNWSRVPRYKPFSSEIYRQIEFSTFGEYPSPLGIFASGGVADFVVDLPEYPNVFSGKAVINRLSDSMDSEGRFTRECLMDLVGDFQVRFNNLPSG